MSGEVIATPVAKYGRSSEFGVVLDFIQAMMSDDTLRQAFNIPHLVMVGRQNMAKTTLINRLIGRYLLPMRRNETANTLQARTTYPIILNLRNGEKSLVEVKCDLLGLREAAKIPRMMPWRHFLTKSQYIYRRKRELQFRKPLLMLLCKVRYIILTRIQISHIEII